MFRNYGRQNVMTWQKCLRVVNFPESAHHTTILLFIEISSSQFCRFKRIDLYVLGYINQLGR